MSLFEAYRPQARGDPLEDIRVRMARPRDAAALAALVIEREGRDPVEALAGARRELAVLAAHPRRRHRLFVAECGGRLVGFGRVAFRRYSRIPGVRGLPDGWYLTGIIVDPAWRRRGVGRALTAHRLAWLRGRARTVHYFASSANRTSIRLHETFGFREADRVEHPRVSFTGGVGIRYALQVKARNA